MNNNLYNWHDERMVDLEMREINRELSQANLLKEAGLSGSDWLARATGALGGLLKGMRKSLEPRASVERPPYQSRGRPRRAE